MSGNEDIGRLYQPGKLLRWKEEPLVVQMSRRMVLVTEEEKARYSEESCMQFGGLGEHGFPCKRFRFFNQMNPAEIEVVENMTHVLNREGYVLGEGVQNLFMLFRGKSIVHWLGPARDNKNGRSYSINFEDVVVSVIERDRRVRLEHSICKWFAIFAFVVFFLGFVLFFGFKKGSFP